MGTPSTSRGVGQGWTRGQIILYLHTADFQFLLDFFESTPGLFRTLSVHTRDSLSAGLEYGFQLSCLSPCSLVSWQHIY